MSGAGRRPPRTRAIRPSLQPSPRTGPEIDRLVLPGGIERREIGRVRIGQLQSSADTSSSFGLAVASATSARNTAS